MHARRMIVVSLESLCSALDRVPRYDRTDGRWYRAGCWGCHPLRISYLAVRLDERWRTSVWA